MRSETLCDSSQGFIITVGVVIFRATCIITLWLQSEVPAIFDQYCLLSQASPYHSVFRIGFVIILNCKD
jgi:hypothetical protein